MIQVLPHDSTLYAKNEAQIKQIHDGAVELLFDIFNGHYPRLEPSIAVTESVWHLVFCMATQPGTDLQLCDLTQVDRALNISATAIWMRYFDHEKPAKEKRKEFKVALARGMRFLRHPKQSRRLRRLFQS